MTLTPYLQSSEYASYGVPDATAALVQNATLVVNNYLRRPEGLVYATDANGMPAWMASMFPALSYTIPAGVAAGADATATIPNAQFSNAQIGEVVILDRANPSLAEACVVNTVSGTTLTFDNVQFAHSANATIDFGLTIREERRVLPTNPFTFRLSRAPVAKLLTGWDRYAPKLLPRDLTDSCGSLGVLELLIAPSSPPAWTEFDVTQVDVNAATGVVWTQWPSTLTPFTDVRVHYVAGWAFANLPADVKQAVANIVRGMIDAPLSGNAQNLKTGNASITRFAPTALDADARALLAPYRIVGMG